MHFTQIKTLGFGAIGLILLIFLSGGCYHRASQIEKPPITPYWALGHIVWEDSINTRYAAQTLVNMYDDYKIPVGGIIIDSPWSLSYNDFNWDTVRYPDPEGMIRFFSERRLKVILWLTGCVNITARDVPVEKSPDYDYVIEKEYVVNGGNPSEWWKGKGVHLDFTSEEATRWWESKLDKVYGKGVAGWKVDQGEYYFGDSLSLSVKNRIAGQDHLFFGDSLLTSIGRISIREFKGYYYDFMYEYATKKNPVGMTMARPFSHQGSFAANIPKLSLGWSGDFEGNWEGLKLQIDNIYTSAKAGYGALACEIGGFYNSRSDKSQLLRYAQFASMTACMVNGGANGAFTNHLPWYHDREATDIYRYYVTLHYQLRPYIFSSLVDAHLNGGSLLKDVSLMQESHKLGNDLFYKAITSDNNQVSFTLPQNEEWIDFRTGKIFKGGSVITKNYSLDEAPIFVRSGAIIPLEIENSVTGIGDESFAGKTVFLIYPDGYSRYIFHRPIGEGVEYEDINVVYKDGAISVISEKVESFVFLVKYPDSFVKVSGSDGYHYHEADKLIEIEKRGKIFTVKVN